MFREYMIYDRFCVTKKGTLIGGLEIGGRDPDGLSSDDFTGLSLIARSLYQNLPECVRSLTQYYVHREGVKVRFKKRESAISDYLSANREKFLNEKNLSGSRIIHLFEIDPDEMPGQGAASFAKHLLKAFKSRQSRKIIADRLSFEKTINLYAESLEKQRRDLADILDEAKSRWDGIFACRTLDKSGLWAFCRFLANMEPEMMLEAETENVPDEQWDLLLAEGDHYPVSINSQDFLKFQNTENSYARILSATRFSEEAGEAMIQPGQWAAKAHSPVRQKGNYVIMCRYAPLSKIRQGMMFTGKKNELYRKNLNFMSVIRGLSEGQSKTGSGRFDNLKPVIAKKMRELEEAEGLGEKWGHMHAMAVAFGKSPEKVNATLKTLRKSMVRAGMSVVVEGIDLPDAYKTIMPGGRESAARDMQVNTTQFGALSLIYKQAEGQITVDDLRGEEAQYVFQSADGSPFYYSPFCGGRCVVIGVGPIRSGKSFAKNTLGGHFVKYGGVYRAIDIDPGSEPLAQFFRDQGAIFRIGRKNSSGFNSFKAVAKGPDDFSFISHFKQLVMQMLKSNDSPAMRELDAHEQQQLDEAVTATLKLPDRLRGFSSMVNHCPEELQRKLSRWHGEGIYAGLFDQEDDALGPIEKPVAAFNLAGVKDDPTLLPLTISEITYRVTRMFEDPDYRSVPKYLDIDEAHAPLKIDYFRDYIIRSVRTWGKWLGGIGLWSQDPGEFRKIPDWSALRSAASALFFMSDPTIDEKLYRDTFRLTDGEIEAIRELRPKKEAYIIQRDIGVSKTIIIEVEPEQHVISTSRPYEADLRQKMIDKYGIREGIQKTIEELKLNERRQ